MKMTKTISWALAFSLVAASFSAVADRDDHRGGDRHDDRGGWHGDIHHFNDHDMTRWRGGHWHHGYHDGRLGWWWVVGSLWFFYPQWVRGYPDPYTPPPTVIIQPAPQTVPNTPPPTQYWYYCDASRTYYPYVQSCPGGWRMVPAAPSATPGQ
jgi:hypothetical protein